MFARIFIIALLGLSSASFATLHEAAGDGDFAEVSRLLAAGAEVNDVEIRGNTPLHVAAMNGHVAVVQALINAGAGINVQDVDGNTAIHIAALNGHVAVVHALINAGAGINVQDLEGNTPLNIAALNGYVDVILALINAGAGINVQDIDGNTAIHIAALNGHVDVILALLNAGADLTITNNHGHTPIQVATNQAVIEIIVQWQQQQALVVPWTPSLQIPRSLALKWGTMRYVVNLDAALLRGWNNFEDLTFTEICELIFRFLKLSDVYKNPLLKKKPDGKGPSGFGGAGRMALTNH